MSTERDRARYTLQGMNDVLDCKEGKKKVDDCFNFPGSQFDDMQPEINKVKKRLGWKDPDEKNKVKK